MRWCWRSQATSKAFRDLSISPLPGGVAFVRGTCAPYGEFWQQSYENEPQLKMGINLVIYALTMEGSLALKLKGAGI